MRFRQLLTTTVWLLLACAAIRARADFAFGDFSSAAGLNLVGSAAAVSGRLRLTPNVPEQSGAAWFAAPVAVAGGFHTAFDFQLTGGNGSDGFAFLVQNDGASALFGPGGRLGYGGFGDETGGIANSVAVQFDTFQNAENNDPSDNYASVQSRGTLPNSTNHLYTLGQGFPATDINDGAVHHVAIDYQPGVLSVSFDGAPLLTAPVNLETLLLLDGDAAYVGFTAGTGSDSENQDILNWQFASVPEPPTFAVALAGLAGLVLGRWRSRRGTRAVIGLTNSTPWAGAAQGTAMSPR